MAKFATVTLVLVALLSIHLARASSTVDDAKKSSSATSTSDTSKSSTSASTVGPPQVFAFGDQYLDTGMTNHLESAGWKADMEPYGIGFKAAPGRFSNGRLTIDLITEDMGSDYLMPYITKSLVSKQGTSFATAGAGTKPWINSNQTWSLQHQLEFFSQYAADRRGMKFNTAVFVISIGTNDYLDAILGDGGDKAAADLVSSTTNAIVDAILVLFKTTRATKFVVYDLAPLGCIPAVRLAKGLVSESAGCYEPANQIAAEHNQALSMKLDKLRAAGVKDLILFRMSSGFENLLLKDGTGKAAPHTPWLPPTPPAVCIPLMFVIIADVSAADVSPFMLTPVAFRARLLNTHLPLFPCLAILPCSCPAAFTSKLTPCCQGETPKGERISCGQTVEEGGKNYTASVCEEPAKSVWWDDYNPTEAANNALEFVLWNSNSILYVRPNGLKQALE
ncbi:unnamed protein product [Closterium sp. Naga37s-1]|nr:unnamed protein product [Closterium sp. Naga37s-1]